MYSMHTMLDLRDLPEERKAKPATITLPNDDLTLSDFLNGVKKSIDEVDDRFFVRLIFPHNVVFDAKYKFSNDILIPKEYKNHLNHKVSDVYSIFDDGGRGLFAVVTMEALDGEKETRSPSDDD